MKSTMGESYEPIYDWSREGRMKLVAEQGDYIRLLLDEAFSNIIDRDGDVSLTTLGFRGDDPVDDAVQWSLERFANGDLDPTKIHPESRSFRIFTEAKFWLSQKAGRGYQHLLRSARGVARAAGNEEPAGSAETMPELTEKAFTFGQELAATLPRLRERTCADIVGFWLHGTKRLRRDVFGWPSQAELSGAAVSSSRKQQSLHAHDAMFRFLCCFFGLVPAKPEAHAERALELTCLSGCPNEAPYRVKDRDVIDSLAAPGVHGPRLVGDLRKQGAATLLGCCLDHARDEAKTRRGHLVAFLAHQTISPTTLHALSIENDKTLKTRIQMACGRTDAESTT